MKKMLLLAVVCGLLLTACGGAPKPAESAAQSAPAESYEPLDPYKVLDFPTNVTFGMHRDEVVEITGANFTSVTGIVDSDLKIYLDHYCLVSKIAYLFGFKDVEEFEDGTTLDEIRFEIIDLIPQSKRTKEAHGDIDAEYNTIYARLVEKYGEPDIKVEDGQEYKRLRRSVWENEEGMGIILNLSQRTSALDQGYIYLTYLDPTRYQKSWVEDYGW